jgi:hypothetical protein
MRFCAKSKIILISIAVVFKNCIIDYCGFLNSSEYWQDEISPNSIGAKRLSTISKI